MEDRVFNEAMLRLITRADLENHMIGRAIIAALLQTDFMKFEVLYSNVRGKFDAVITEKTFRRHIEFVNDKFRLINNMDMKHEITIAQIYEITVEVDGAFYTRMALVHNIR